MRANHPGHLAECLDEFDISQLRLYGLDPIADRLRYLYQLVKDDPDEPPINLHSLRQLVHFLVSERHLGNPQIGINPDGLTHVEWRVDETGILAMEFLASGLIRFAAISAPAHRGLERQHVSGTYPKRATLAAVRPFTDRLSST